MEDKNLNIVSFSIPWPANYGGVIDVFHKLVALKASGIHIHLHCFQYDRPEAAELEKYCETVHYYKRETSISALLSLTPYIVKSRRSEELLRNLCKNEYPILFEGLHSCYYLNHPLLKDRKLYYRESNIEHTYYYHLFLSENNIFKKIFFITESLKLRLYQSKLKRADHFLTVSGKDCEYLQMKFPQNKVSYLPSFHGNNELKSLTGSGSYAFYHGNLAVAENSLAASFLIREVFSRLKFPLVIAGLNPPDHLLKLAEQFKVKIIANPDNDQMFKLLSEAHVNILVTFQATGLKLKLLNTLFAGRHVLVNQLMLAGTGLDEFCFIGNNAAELYEKMEQLIKLPFDEEKLAFRKQMLGARYSDSANALKLTGILFPEKS